MKQVILDVVRAIQPYDELERQHRDDAMSWILSDDSMYRQQNPGKHIVSYFVLFDEKQGKLMLIDHVKAGLWLPTGGHVEDGEHPRATVLREADEELQLQADFHEQFGDKPVFITVTQTKGAGTHTDVSLWYVLKGDSNQVFSYDPREMNGYKWMLLQDILDTNVMELDPHMHRFVRKLQLASC
ncbi:MAG TPA: NUDIX hydrolase [Candidatus Saccharimonadales bacterium]|nr:NUDIX hydrolase [Candidatus Saccharimonadales bacterium]